MSQLQDATIHSGQEVCLECRVSGKPLPRVSWFKDGQEFKVNHKRLEYTDRTGVIRMNLLDCQPEDAGVYKCAVKNDSGEAENECTLKIVAKSPKSGQQDGGFFKELLNLLC